MNSEQDRLVCENLAMARNAALRLVGVGDRTDDAVQDAMVGLVQAARNFRPDSGVPFRAFASRRVFGAVVDGMRRDGSASRLHVNRRIADIRQAFFARNRRQPTDEELAAELGISVARARASSLASYRSFTLSLDDAVFDENDDGRDETLTLGEIVADPDAPAPDADDTPEVLLRAVKRLPHREQVVIGLRFTQSCTLREIGAVLDVTESRACQLLTRACKRLAAMPDVVAVK